MPSTTQIAVQDEQEQLLDDAMGVVKTNANQMKIHLDQNRLIDAIKSCSNMLLELRANLLSPKSYYELYMAIFDEMRHFETYLHEEFKKGNKCTDLYELVQYTGNIVPRLYLVITVGVVFIKVGELSRKEILRDLVEMCRGVQHPLRGLFLRNYLLQCLRSNLLPDSLSEQQQQQQLQQQQHANSSGGGEAAEAIPDGTTQDSVDFILVNFSEMNKLWVRMQHQGHSRDRRRREEERKQLCLLVGTNLERLSQLDTVNVGLYAQRILPTVLEQIVECRDAIAQEYLMEILVKVFPAEYQLATLREYLDVVPQLEPAVSYKTIVCGLIDRIHQFILVESGGTVDQSLTLAATDKMSGSGDGKMQLFEIFSQQISNLLEKRQENVMLADIIAMETVLLRLALSLYPDNHQLINGVLEGIVQAMKKSNQSDINFSSQLGKELIKLFKLPIDSYEDVRKMFQLAEFPNLLEYIDTRGRRHIAAHLLRRLLAVTDHMRSGGGGGGAEASAGGVGGAAAANRPTLLQSETLLDPFFKCVQVLLSPSASVTTSSSANAPPPTSAMDEFDREEFDEEQDLLARALHLFQFGSQLDEHCRVLTHIKKLIGQCGFAQLRYLFPPLMQQALMLALRFHDERRDSDEQWQKKVKSLLKVYQEGVERFIANGHMETALRFYLYAAMILDKLTHLPDAELIAYEMFSQAFTLYEEEIGDSSAQLCCLTLITASLQRMTRFSDDNHSPLRTQCARAGAGRLVKKADQSRAVMQVAHVFWSGKCSGGGGAGEDVSGRGATMADEIREEKRVVSCLERSGKLAKECLDQTVKFQLFVELLNNYLYFYLNGCSTITKDTINALIQLIESGLSELESNQRAGSSSDATDLRQGQQQNSGDLKRISAHFKNTMRYLKWRQNDTSDEHAYKLANEIRSAVSSSS